VTFGGWSSPCIRDFHSDGSLPAGCYLGSSDEAACKVARRSTPGDAAARIGYLLEDCSPLQGELASSGSSCVDDS
jgi:hypothetical protein